ncbi:MAG: GldG family protein, partial [Fidelibacterota bacterium]
MKFNFTQLFYTAILILVIGLFILAVQTSLTVFNLIPLIFGGLLLLVVVVRYFEDVKDFLGKRSTRYGTNAVVMSIFVLGILSLLNFSLIRHNYRVDTTAGGQFSLADQTVKILKGLKKDVKITAFEREANTAAIDDLLREYRYHSDRIDYEIVDVDKNPEIARRYKITKYGEIVVESGDKEERIDSGEEEKITNAILKVSREGKKVIYFLTGHGEKSIESEEREGFSNVKKAIENQNYEVKELLLAGQERIPEDCSLLIISGPEKDLFDKEKELIRDFIERGGNAFFMLDPQPSAGLSRFLKQWNIKVGKDVVVDASGIGRLFGASPAIPLVNEYGKHEITKEFRYMTFFPLTRSISTIEGEDKREDVKTTVLARTGPQSWGETDV